MSKKTALKEKFYQQEMFDNDGVFKDMIKKYLKPEFKILDAGAGAGEIFKHDFKDQVTEIIGADLDPRVEENPQVHRGYITDLTETPFEDNYFDLTFNRYVLEHIADPEKFLKEMSRITKPGGFMIFLTPNKWHYVSVIARFTPHKFHEWVNKKRGREEDDTFPTVYKLNSGSDIKKQFRRYDFESHEIIYRECSPNYLLFSYATFIIGVLYEKIVNSTTLFYGLRVNIVGCFRKKSEK